MTHVPSESRIDYNGVFSASVPLKTSLVGGPADGPVSLRLVRYLFLHSLSLSSHLVIRTQRPYNADRRPPQAVTCCCPGSETEMTTRNDLSKPCTSGLIRFWRPFWASGLGRVNTPTYKRSLFSPLSETRRSSVI